MAEEKEGFFKRLVNGLTKTRDSIVAGIDSIFSGYSNIDDDFYEEIEEILVMGDIGINTTTKIIDTDHQHHRFSVFKFIGRVAYIHLFFDALDQKLFALCRIGGAGDRCQWSRKNDLRRKAGRPSERSGQKGCSCGSRYVPCSGRRTAHRVGAPCRRGHHRRTERSRSGVDRIRCSRSGKSQKCGCADL